MRDTTDDHDVCVPVVLDDDRTGAAGMVADLVSAGATWIMIGAWSQAQLRLQISRGPPE